MIPVSRSVDTEVISIDALKLLRRRAQDNRLYEVVLPLDTINEMKPEDVQLLFHELRVHQVELESQNEELRRVQVELELARERYFDLYDLAPVGYCTVNDEGIVLEANLTVGHLLGVPRNKLVNRSITRFVVHAQLPAYHQCCQQVREFELTHSCELQMTQADGTPIWVSLAINGSKNSEGVSTLRVMLKDITAKKQLEAALQAKNVELQNLRQVADKANLAKSDFLANMSHELRSPLNAILGFAQLIDAGNPAPTKMQKSALDQILHGGWYLLELVNEILDLASIESGKLALNLGPESLSEVLADCQIMIAPQAASSGIQISFPDLLQPCQVLADRRRLKQVVINLLSNAIKYNRVQGQVNVSWSLQPNQRVRISVQDSGLGLSAHQLTQLFQPFNRLGQEAGALEGTGIGLVVSKRLVEMMGGRIGASSTVGVGSLFWFDLQLSEAKP